MWKVPLFDLSVGKKEIEAVKKVIESKWISIGAVTKEFEKIFAEALKVKYAVAVSNGTAALHLALMALGLKRGDEVIVPSLTFVATANAVKYTGARPVFADIESTGYPVISCREIRRKITSKTRAILVVHYAGYPARMEEIMNIAKKHNLKVVEDTAHAPIVFYNGKGLGTWGDIGCFSFFSNKNITTAEGGMVLAKDDKVAEKIRVLRSHGMTTTSFERFGGQATSYDVVALGYNYRIDDIRSALGIAQLNRFSELQGKRERIAGLYRKLLPGIDGVEIPFLKERVSAFHIQPVLVNKKNRDEVKSHLHNDGIQTSFHYHPVHLFKIYKKAGWKEGDLPVTEDYALREITLPLYPAMKDGDVKIVVKSLKGALAGK